MVTLFGVTSCGNGKNASSNLEGQVQTNPNEDNAEGEASEPELLETNFSFQANLPLEIEGFLKDYYRVRVDDLLEGKRSGWIWYNNRDFYHLYNIKINYDDGSASGICYKQVTPEDSTGKFTVNVDTTLCSGIWKSRSVKRGKNYVEAYEIQLDCEPINGKLKYNIRHISIYTTDKFDFAFVGWGENQDANAYYNFSDGKKESCYKISDLKHKWK